MDNQNNKNNKNNKQGNIRLFYWSQLLHRSW